MENRNAKQWSSMMIKTLSIILINISVFFLCASDVAAASPIEKLSEIQEKLKTRLLKVKETHNKEKSVINKIEDLKRNINRKEKELKKFDRKIIEIKSRIRKLSKEIDLLGSKMDLDKKYLKSFIRALHKRQYGGKTLILSSAGDYQDLIRRSRYISLIARYESEVVNRYNGEIMKVVSKKSELQALNEQLEASKKQVKAKKRELQTGHAQKDKLLAILRSKRNAYERKIKELKKSSKRLRGIVGGLRGRKIPQSILGKGFKSLRGNLPWPVNGKILTGYGKNNEPKFNITIFKDGIEIAAKPDSIAKSVAGGRVVYADTFKGYGNLMIIDHGSGYHSLYGNLDRFFLDKDELLIEGMEVGKIRNSDRLNAPILYFEIRYKGRPIDPMKWLKEHS